MRRGQIGRYDLLYLRLPLKLSNLFYLRATQLRKNPVVVIVGAAPSSCWFFEYPGGKFGNFFSNVKKHGEINYCHTEHCKAEGVFVHGWVVTVGAGPQCRIGVLDNGWSCDAGGLTDFDQNVCPGIA